MRARILVVQVDDHVHLYDEADRELAATVATVALAANMEAGVYRASEERWAEVRAAVIGAGGTVQDHRKSGAADNPGT